MRRRAAARYMRPESEDVLALSFLDVLSCGLGAAIYLFLVFSTLDRSGDGTSSGARGARAGSGVVGASFGRLEPTEGAGYFEASVGLRGAAPSGPWVRWAWDPDTPDGEVIDPLPPAGWDRDAGLAGRASLGEQAVRVSVPLGLDRPARVAFEVRTPEVGGRDLRARVVVGGRLHPEVAFRPPAGAAEWTPAFEVDPSSEFEPLRWQPGVQVLENGSWVTK